MKRPWTMHRITEEPRIHLGFIFKGFDLRRRNWPSRVVVHDAINDGLKLGVLVTAPNEVVTGKFDEELVLTGRDGRRGLKGRVSDALVFGGGGGLSLDCLVDGENEEDEKEWGEELEKCGPLAPP